MDSLVYVAISLSGVLIALTLSVVSLVLHYVRRKETPEYTELSSQIRVLSLELTEIIDKFKHQVNRDNVRRARAGSEDKLAAAPEPSTPAEYKTKLRRKATAAGMGVR